MHVILSNHDFAAADCMPILAAASGHFHDRRKEYDALVHAIQDAIAWMNANPKAAAEFLAADQGGKMSAADRLAEIQQPGVKFSSVPSGEAALAKFMQKIGSFQGRLVGRPHLTEVARGRGQLGRMEARHAARD